MKATYDNVIIRLLETQRSTSIIMPDSEMSFMDNQGIIIDVGPLCKENLNIGNKVVFLKGEGRPVEELIVINEKHLLAIIQE